MKEVWTKPYPPFRMVGSIHWVGSYDLSSYLIAGADGHILINSGIEQSGQRIAARVESLGFSMGDIKILTATHGHHDHVAGMADLKRLTGARLVVADPDRPLYESGGRADFRFGDTPETHFPAVEVDGTFVDGDVLTVGDLRLIAHHHPGHTKGATSFTLTVTDDGTPYKVGIVNMPTINAGVDVRGMPGYPTISDDYRRTFAELKGLDIDVWLSSHASHFFMHQKHQPGSPARADRFVDHDGLRSEVLRLEQVFLERLGR